MQGHLPLQSSLQFRTTATLLTRTESDAVRIPQPISTLQQDQTPCSNHQHTTFGSIILPVCLSAFRPVPRCILLPLCFSLQSGSCPKPSLQASLPANVSVAHCDTASSFVLPYYVCTKQPLNACVQNILLVFFFVRKKKAYAQSSRLSRPHALHLSVPVFSFHHCRFALSQPGYNTTLGDPSAKETFAHEDQVDIVRGPPGLPSPAR